MYITTKSYVEPFLPRMLIDRACYSSEAKPRGIPIRYRLHDSGCPILDW